MKQQKTKRFLSPLMNKGSLIAMVMLMMVFGVIASGCQQTDKPQPKPSVAVGTWIDSEKVAEKDGLPHPMKYRIDSIIRDQETVAAAIEAYNLSGTGTLIGKLENDHLEFCLAEYSASYPKDFPYSVFGITDAAVSFEIVSMNGGEIQIEDTVYKNLSTTWEIGEQPQVYEFHGGDTYHGQIVFIMVKGYGDYLLHEIKEDSGDDGQNYIKGE